MSTIIQYVRVLAGEVHVGDRVARARTHTFLPVTAVRHGERAVRLVGPDIRPLKTAKLWREVVVVKAHGRMARLAPAEDGRFAVLVEDERIGVVYEGEAGWCALPAGDDDYGPVYLEREKAVAWLVEFVFEIRSQQAEPMPTRTYKVEDGKLVPGSMREEAR